MLRVRSGGTPEPKSLQPETATADLGKVVAEARAEMDRLVQLGELQNDPIRHPIRALSVHLDALQRVALAQAAMRPAQSPGAPPDEAVIRRAVLQGIQAHAGHLVGALNVRNMLLAAGLLLVALLIGAGAGYWYAVTSRGVPVVARCDPHPAGQPFNCTMQMRGE